LSNTKIDIAYLDKVEYKLWNAPHKINFTVIYAVGRKQLKGQSSPQQKMEDNLMN